MTLGALRVSAIALSATAFVLSSPPSAALSLAASLASRQIRTFTPRLEAVTPKSIPRQFAATEFCWTRMSPPIQRLSKIGCDCWGFP
jgi:hypothetical protein